VCYAGKVALDSLGFDVEVYYASEVDANAMLVAQHRHQGMLQHVGDVSKLTAAQVRYMTVCILVIIVVD